LQSRQQFTGSVQRLFGTPPDNPGFNDHRHLLLIRAVISTGLMGTTGAPFIDYIIADKIVAPLEYQQFFTEKIVHLPGCSG
jgi:Glycosyl transferase family 41